MDKVMQIVEEEVELTKTRISARIKRIFRDDSQTSPRINMRLKFENKISKEILTGEEIKGEGNTPIEVSLVADPIGNIVYDGPEASANFEIVLLKGETNDSEGNDWTAEEFNENIVPEEEGKQPLLAGNIPLKLQRGTGFVENIKLRHRASKIRPPLFKLGARVVDESDGVRIKEAKTESFTVKDFRSKYYKKHKTPSLCDEVPRLVNIRKGGTIDKCLQYNKIRTVEDFLIQLLINRQGLRSIVKLPEKKWEATVKNAQACQSDSKMYCYTDLEKRTGVVFNVLGQVQGLYYESQYSPTCVLQENHKELLASAYEHWKDVKPFDDINSLQQYFSDFSTYINPPDPLETHCPDDDHENTLASELVGESSSRYSNMSFHSVGSAMNSRGESGAEDLGGSFNTDDVETFKYGDTIQFSPCSPFNPNGFFQDNGLFQDFDEFILQNDGRYMQPDGLKDVRNADEQSAQDVQTSNSPRRWKKLFCVSRWFSIRKMVSLDFNRNQKKQKLG